MVKYKLLTQAELEDLQKEFIDYLAANGIDADYWQKLKKEHVEKANKIVAFFSDVVYESILRRVSFMDLISKNEISSFQCLEDAIIVVGIRSEDDRIDFLKGDVNTYLQNSSDKFKIYTSKKDYGEVREMELFKMMERGCIISDGSLFKIISLGL